MIGYKLKVVHDEYDTLNLYPSRHNGKYHPREENNLDDDSSMFLYRWWEFVWHHHCWEYTPHN